ncbi:MAG: hypothetical protein H6633_34480 [Anaerolineales bacterium]|nr:hypothetical protein [Anaerolineales bacterium]
MSSRPYRPTPTWPEAIEHVTRYLRYIEPGEKVTAELDELPPGVLRGDGWTGLPPTDHDG